MRKGIILAGGRGTRLYPLTDVMSKQLLPVYDKPMIYYPLCTLMTAGIREILLISTPRDIERFRDLLGDGSRLGVRFEYATQSEPNGIAQALCIAADFIGAHSVALILGDNLFHHEQLGDVLHRASIDETRATLFGYSVNDPARYGVAEFDEHGRITRIIEKPDNPPSQWAVTGLYFYPAGASEVAESINKSARGEYEITDVNNAYIGRGNATFERLSPGVTWLDAGTHETLHDAATVVREFEEHGGRRISCPEEVAWRMGFIDTDDLLRLGSACAGSSYGDYLLSIPATWPRS